MPLTYPENTIWYLEVRHGDDARSSGSAVAIRLRKEGEAESARTYLLTCAHVLRGKSADGRLGYGPPSTHIRAWKPDSGFDASKGEDMRVFAHSNAYSAEDIPHDARNGVADDWVLLEFANASLSNNVDAVRTWPDDDLADGEYEIIGYPGGPPFTDDIVRPVNLPTLQIQKESNGVLTSIGSNTRPGTSGGGIFHSESKVFAGLHRSRIDSQLRIEGISARKIHQHLEERELSVVTFDSSTENDPTVESEDFGTGLKEFVRISEGTFMMGSPASEADSCAFEQPQHEVLVPAFDISIYPVTNADFLTYLEANQETQDARSDYPGWEYGKPVTGLENHPIRGVTWFEAMRFCRWLSDKTDKKYTLPTETQWERSARGKGDCGPFPWGAWQEDRAHHYPDNPDAVSAKVDQYPSQNAAGCHDIVGNVPEWTRSIWGPSILAPDDTALYENRIELEKPYQESIPIWDKIPFLLRVVRGGGFHLPKEALRCSARSAYFPESGGIAPALIGFRLVREV